MADRIWVTSDTPTSVTGAAGGRTGKLPRGRPDADRAGQAGKGVPAGRVTAPPPAGVAEAPGVKAPSAGPCTHITRSTRPARPPPPEPGGPAAFSARVR